MGSRAFAALALLTVTLAPAIAPAEEATGQWMGVLGGTDHVVLRIWQPEGGAYTASVANLQRGAAVFAADRVSITSENMSLAFAQLRGAYEAKWDAASAQWIGTWTQNGGTRPLSFARTSDAAVAAAKPRRPQDEAVAKGPRPYTNEEVAFENLRAHVRLAGTLSVPNGRGPFPGVLLITAAGAETRDEEAGGHLVFVVLADYLLRQGIAVLRYDKRGVGASTGDLGSATFEDLVADASVAFRYLRARPEVDPDRVGAIGHSEGGSIAPAIASSDRDVAFVVAMAGSGLSGQFRITQQQVFMAQENGATPEQVERIRALCQRIYQVVADSGDDAMVGARITALLDESAAATTVPAQTVEGMRRLMTPKFVREVLRDDPLRYLKRVKVPVLGLVGSLDQIVLAGPYVEAMSPVLAKIPGSKVVVLPQLNHVLQTAKTGSPREFSAIEETISPVGLKTIGDWIAERVKQAPTSNDQSSSR